MIKRATNHFGVDDAFRRIKEALRELPLPENSNNEKERIGELLDSLHVSISSDIDSLAAGDIATSPDGIYPDGWKWDFCG